MNYEGKILEELSTLRMGFEIKIKGEEASWFLPFYRAYISYLARLPSVSEVYLRAKQEIQLKLTYEAMIEDVFRLINQINLLTESMNVVFNTIGRYFKDKIGVYAGMFEVLSR